MGKGIEKLLERVKAMRGVRLRVVYADGGEALVSPKDAIVLLQGHAVARFEALGDMQGQGYLLDLLNGLCGGSDDEQGL